MSGRMKILIYGEEPECRETEQFVRAHPDLKGKPPECCYVTCHDDLLQSLLEWHPCLTIILRNGALGMEGVFAVRDNHPESVVFWFSDDHGFGMMSHRLDCEYFAVKPVTCEKLHRAFHRCAHVGVSFET